MSINVALLLTGAIVLIAVMAGWLVARASESLHADTQRVEAARIALTEHRQAVRRLLEADTLDDGLRRFVISFSSGMLSRDVAHFVAEIVQQHSMGTLDPDPRAAGFRDRLAELARRSPEMYELMTVAMRSGLIASLLQWPETTAAAVRIAVESEAQSTGTAVRAERKAETLAFDFAAMPIAA